MFVELLQYYCKKKCTFDYCSSAMQISGVFINVQRDVDSLLESLLTQSELPLQLKFEE